MAAPRDPYRYFRGEARELLEGLERGVTALEQDKEDSACLPTLLRYAHTLKGAARVVRLPALSQLAHRLEEVLAPCRENAVRPSGPQQAELREAIAAIAACLADLDRPAPPPPPPGDASPPAPAAAPALLDTVRLQAVEVDLALSSVAGTSAELNALRTELRALDQVGQQARLVRSLAMRGRSAETAARLPAEAGDLAVRLESAHRRFTDRVDRVARDLQRLHEDTSRLRLIPTEALWTFLEQVARDAAHTLGKRMRLETTSRAPRLDTPVFAGLQEALLHLVRNAVAHGLETETERRSAGKSPEGVVRLRIEPGRNRLRIECEDDGCGIDTEAVRRAAVAKGWRTGESSGVPMTMEEAIQLLLRGGVTTASTVNVMSGRGVGLEAARAAVARLGGEFTLRSTPGGGTTATIDVPVTFSALEVLAVTAGGADWLLPLGSVRRVLRTTAAEIRGDDRGERLCVDGRLLPYAALGRLVRPGVTPGRAQQGRPTIAVIVHAQNGLAAIGVDRLSGTTEAILRPLPALAVAAAFVAGASLEAGGKPRLAIDVEELVAAVAAAGAKPPEAVVAHAPILVVDDSLTTRMLEQSILESAGYTVEVAASGEEALERLRVRRYALLLVDVEMPGMDGFALIEQLRRDPEWRTLPAILVTSREAPEDRRRGLAAGAQDYVVKGEFDQGRLLRRIGELLA